MKTIRFSITAMCITVLLWSMAGCGKTAQEKKPDTHHTNAKATCTVASMDGQYYLRIDGEAAGADQWGDLAAALEFPSLTDLRNTLKSEKFTDSQIYIMQETFEKDENGIKICDPDRLYEPVLPEDLFWRATVTWGGDIYSFSLGSNTGNTFGSIVILTEEAFRLNFEYDYVQFFTRPQIKNVVQKEVLVENIPATQHTYSTDVIDGKSIRYDIAANGKTLHVKEEYILASTNEGAIISETVPDSIRIYGEQNDVYFLVYLYRFASQPTVAWLSSFALGLFHG